MVRKFWRSSIWSVLTLAGRPACAANTTMSRSATPNPPSASPRSSWAEGSSLLPQFFEDPRDGTSLIEDEEVQPRHFVFDQLPALGQRVGDPNINYCLRVIFFFFQFF